MPERNFDLILYGASGFTGRLVAEYLHRSYPADSDMRWAMAGRDLDKLTHVRADLGAEAIPLIQADSRDEASLDNLTRQTRVVCSTVGPYAKYGTPVVAACVRNNTHYCDLAGEVQWIRRIIDAFHEEALEKKLRIVPCCGYDSIPSDLGLFFLQQKALEQYGTYCTRVKNAMKVAKGGASGGTVASITNLMAEAEQDKSIYGLLADPYGLNPRGDQKGADKGDLDAPRFDPQFQAWTGPFLMASINTRVVRRGHALRGWPYGKNFRFEEFTLAGKGMKGRFSAYVLALTQKILSGAKPGSLSKKLLDWFAPKPGEGPSRETRENGFWIFDQIGTLPDSSLLRSRVKGDRDPGYGSTSKMLAEAAVCLAKDGLPENYGVGTPAYSMGEALVRRLEEKAGLSFSIKDE